MSLHKDTILVTGGSGFLGQHVVKHLQERCKYLKEIRVLDIKPYANKLDYKDNVPVTSILGDLCNISDLNDAFIGVQSVIHIAGLISFGTFPDFNSMEKTNVGGTANVIQACVKQNVSRLIFCSTIDVVIGEDEIINGNEENTSRPVKYLFPGYPDTKQRSEELVLQAHGKELANGGTLKTISLRPNVMYGEEDPYFVINPLRSARDACGVLYQVGDGTALFQPTYVGNAAWAFVLAENVLKHDPKPVGGEAFFIPDDSKPQNVFNFLKPFLISRGYRLSAFHIPYWPIHVLFYILELFLFVLSPIKRINLKTCLCSIRYTNMTIYFSSDKACKLLGYKPLYTPTEAMSRAVSYYKNMYL